MFHICNALVAYLKWTLNMITFIDKYFLITLSLFLLALITALAYF